MKFLSLVVLINLVLIKIFKINEVGIYMYIYIYIYIYLLLLSTFKSNTIVEPLCYWLMLGKKMLFAHFVVLLFSHMTFQPSYHIKTEITFMKFKYALIFHEIQTCSHFSFVFRVSSFCNNLVFSLCHNQVHML